MPYEKGLLRKCLLTGFIVCIPALGWVPGVSAGEHESGSAAAPHALEEVVVVGTRIEGRSITDSPVPVDLIREDEILKTGRAELGRVIQALIPSFNFETSTISDGTDSVRPATLRGMLPDQVLVLVNGKRRHGSALIHVNTSVGRGTAGTDINAIPVSAIERIEVLRDGASAQYGSDAVAGVINIVLKDDVDGTLHTSYGQTYDGDGDRVAVRINKGFKVGEDGVVHMALEYRKRKRTNRAGLSGTIQYPDTETCELGKCTGDQLPNKDELLKRYPKDAQVLLSDPGDKEKRFDRSNFRVGDADTDQISGALNFKKSIESIWNGAEVYAFADFSRALNESGGFYRRANQAGRNPQGSLYPNGFLPLIETTVWNFAGGGGIIREFENKLKVDFSVLHGGNTFNFKVKNSHNASWVSCHLGNRDCSDFPNTDFSGRSPTSADSGTLKLFLTTVNLDFSFPMRDSLRLAWGAEYKRDHYQIEAGEPYSYEDYDGAGPGSTEGGIQVFPGLRSSNEVDQSRRSFALYGDSEIFLSDWFMVSPALRYENYSDFGNTINGKVAGKLDVFKQFALRGSVGTGFRAPSMQQLYFNSVSTQFVTAPGVTGLVPFEVVTYRNDSAVAEAVGIPELDVETSLNLSVGFVFQPFSWLTLTTDFYHIQVKDRIILSGRLEARDSKGNPNPELPASVRSALAGLDAAQFFMNAVDTRTQGVDVVALLDVPFMPKGDLSFELLGTLSETEVTSVKLPAGLPSSLFTDRSRSIIEDWQPRSRFTLSGLYELGKFAASVAVHRYGRVHSFRGNVETDVWSQVPHRPSVQLQLGAVRDHQSWSQQPVRRRAR